MRKIEPRYGYRFTTDEIRTHYGSADGAFEACDFNLAGQDAEDGSEIQGISFVLTGLVPKGAEILDKLSNPSPLAQIVRAHAAWYSDDRSQALDILKDVPRTGRDGVLADQIEAMIGRDRIDVFCTAATPNYPMLGVDGRDRYHDPEYELGQFYIKNVGTQLEENAYPYTHDQSFAEFIESLPENERPEFTMSLVSQWLTPRDFDKIDIPRVLWHHDHDLFIHRFYDNYFAYDVNIACTSQEHFELSQIFGGFVATHHYSDVFGVPFSMPKQRSSIVEKKIDVLITGGGTLESFFRDKSSFAFQLSRLGDDISLTVVNGHLPRDEYVDLAGQAKSMPIPSRMCGNPSPRWRDPLVQGALLIYPEGTMYDKIAVGAFPHRNDEKFPEDFLRHLRAQADDIKGYQATEILSDAMEKFAFNATDRDNRMERFYRNAAFLTKFRDYKTRARRKDGLERRHRIVWQLPGLDFEVFGEENCIHKMAALTEAVTNDDYREDEKDLNNLAANWLILGIMLGHRRGFSNSESVPIDIDGDTYSSIELIDTFMKRAFRILRTGLERNPASALLLFNNIHWRFYLLSVLARRYPEQAGVDGDLFADLEPSIRDYGKRFIETFEDMEFDPRAADIGVMSLHEYDPIFPYWDYGSLAVSYCVRNNRDIGGNAPHELDSMRRIILGTVKGILAEMDYMTSGPSAAVDGFRDAYRSYPDNPHLARRAFEVLVEYQKTQTQISDALADEILDTYYSAGTLDPTFFVRNIDKALPVLKTRGSREEIRQLLKDWYYFISRIHDGALNKCLVEDPEYYKKINEFREYFPETLAKNLAAMRSARANKPRIDFSITEGRQSSGHLEQTFIGALGGEPERGSLFSRWRRIFSGSSAAG